MFLRLNKAEHRYHVNFDNVTRVEEYNVMNPSLGTVIYFVDGTKILVQETLRQITGRLNKLESNTNNTNNTNNNEDSDD